MTASRKNEIIAQLVGILNELIEVDDTHKLSNNLVLSTCCHCFTSIYPEKYILTF